MWSDAPTLDFAFEAIVRVAAAREVGDIPAGRRRIIDIAGGEVTGPRLSGRVLTGGADWQIVRTDGVAELEARYTIESDAGALVYVRNTGYRHGPTEIMARLAAGEEVDPDAYYFRTVPTFETAAPELAWLARTIFVCRAARYPDRVAIRFYAVK